MTSLFHQLLILTAEYHILTLKLTRAFDDFNNNLLLIKPLHSMIKSINRLNLIATIILVRCNCEIITFIEHSEIYS